MIQTIKQNKKAVLAFLLALVMLIGLIPFTATEVQAVTIPVGDITTNNSFGNGDTWQDGDELYFCRVSKNNQWAEYTLTANVEDEVTTWTPSEKLYWDDKGEHKLVVNYPADTGWVWDRWYVSADQSTLEKLKAADHMNAMWKGNPTTDPINLNLKHRLSMVTVTYTFASEFADEPDITPEVYSNTQYMLFDINTLERRNVEWQEDHAIWVTPYQHDGANGEKQFTAIVSPDAYSAGNDFIRITIDDQVLTAKMPNDITFEEGKHYTFDLKVGKDVVTIEQVSVNGNDPSIPFSDGWNNEKELDDGSGSITNTQDEGKTAWNDGDQIIATLTSQRYGEQTATLTFSGSDSTWSTDGSFSYLENETPTVKAVYAPSNILGTGEYIEFDCELNGGKLTVKLEGATRNYSRLRIVGLPNKTLTVTTTEFTPAGATSAATAPYTLTTDENGNAFLYGTFAEGATVSVKQGDVVLKEYAFTANKHPGGTERGKSYVLGAVPAIDGTLGGKTTATEEDLTAMVELLRSYIENGMTTIMVTGSNQAKLLKDGYLIPVVSLAFEQLTYDYLDENIDSYWGTVDLIYQDVTEIVEYEFYCCDVLKSITFPKVTTVGDRGFWACYYLETLTFGSVVTAINDNSGEVFYDLGYEIGGCNLVLNAEQVNAATEYQPNVETKTWWNTEWKSITLE